MRTVRNRHSCPRQSVRRSVGTMRLIRECRAMSIALERDMRHEFGYPSPRVKEVLRQALGNFHRRLAVRMRKEGIELATDHSEKIETNAPPLVIGPDID